METFNELPADEQAEANGQWDAHIQEVKGDIRSMTDPSCNKCISLALPERTWYQNAYICDCARKQFEHEWVVDYHNRQRLQARMREVEMTPKCKYCDKKPNCHMNDDIVCWDCYMYWRAK